MIVQQTSLDAFEEHQKNIGKQREMIYTYLKIVKEANNSMIVQSTGIKISSVTPRIYELRKMGLVFLSCFKPCPITKKRTMWWSPKLK